MTTMYLSNISANETLSLDYNAFIVDASGNNIVLTLPDVSGGAHGLYFAISRIDASTNNVTIVPVTGSLLNGLTAGNLSSSQLSTHENVGLVVFGSDWYTLHGKWVS